ncbi:MAG TPA: amidohydrolase family protein [Actinomycetota bacterium]
MDWRDDDPGLPVEFGPCSNGEYDPEPVLPPVLRESIARARAACDENARRTGLSRREFLLSICGAATTLLALDACTREAHRADTSALTSTPGGGYGSIPPDATVDPSPATHAIGGEEFVFDVQGHLLEYDLLPILNGQDFWQMFPQQNCGEQDPKVCYSIDHFMDLMFTRSDTSMLVLSALPIYPAGSPLSHDIMDVTRRIAIGLCQDDRVLLHAQALPNLDVVQSSLAAMQHTAETYPIVAWKTFTHFPDVLDHSGNGWWLDDHDPSLKQVGEKFIRQCVELGRPTFCVHKGFSNGSEYASPRDVGPAAKRNPDANVVVYHSGFEAGTVEGPYSRATANVGVNRLIASLKQAGIGPNENVYAEIGSTWWYTFRYPSQAAHVLGKLLKYVGEDNVLWGTDCLFYGSPQPLIEAMRAFQISPEFQERYGYPKLTEEIKAKILGLNGARLYGVDPITTRCEFTRKELEQIRRQLPGRNGGFGPRTKAAADSVRAHQQGEIAVEIS